MGTERGPRRETPSRAPFVLENQTRGGPRLLWKGSLGKPWPTTDGRVCLCKGKPPADRGPRRKGRVCFGKGVPGSRIPIGAWHATRPAKGSAFAGRICFGKPSPRWGAIVLERKPRKAMAQDRRPRLPLEGTPRQTEGRDERAAFVLERGPSRGRIPIGAWHATRPAKGSAFAGLAFFRAGLSGLRGSGPWRSCRKRSWAGSPRSAPRGDTCRARSAF